MNNKLKQILIKKLEDEFTVSQYKSFSDFILKHIGRISEKDFIDINKPIKFDIMGTVRIAKIQDIHIHPTESILLETGFGNIYYYEAKKPTQKELNKFDGHCLIIK